MKRIGVDESGKGDFFGPLVIAACFVDDDLHRAELEGVKDSKKLTDALALKLAPIIQKTCPFALVAIGPAKYNELYDKIGNLNKLLAWGHARAIEDILAKVECDHVISDQFADPAGLKRALMQRGREVRLDSRVRAESDLAVAAASVLARAEFLKRLKAVGAPFELNLPKGAGPEVDRVGREFLKNIGRDRLGEVAKLHFKTTAKIGG